MNTDGYKQCKLCRDGEYITVRVHQLVAKTFIPNPDDLPEVNHKNFDRTDNRVENLEWATHEENIRYSIRAGRHFCNRDLTGSNNPNYGGKTLKEYYASHPEAAKKILSRPRGQNGHAKRIKMMQFETNEIIGEYDCLLDCAEAFIMITGSMSKPRSLSYRISMAAKNGTCVSGYKFAYL